MLDFHMQSALAHELEIIWFEDIDEIDHVRQDAFLLRGRSAAPPRHAGERRIVGYATVGQAALRVGGTVCGECSGSMHTTLPPVHVAPILGACR